MKKSLVVRFLGLLFAASACFAQQYTITDLGTFGGTDSYGYGINASGQVVGYAATTGGTYHAFRTAANHPIDPATDDLDTLGGTWSTVALSINDSGQVVGRTFTTGDALQHAFRTAANSPINLATDDLGTLNPAWGSV